MHDDIQQNLAGKSKETGIQAMIKPIKPTETASNFFFVCDIENNLDGSLISIDSCWRDEHGRKIHVLHWTWKEWVDWLIPIAVKDKRFRTVYAHNGGGWDWLSLASYLLTTPDRQHVQITASLACSKMITMAVKLANKTIIHFADSLQLLRSSLDKLGRKFVGRGKIETGGLLPHQMEREKMLAYQREDTELLLEVMERALTLVRERIAKIDTFGFTVGSTALKIFKTGYLNQPITTPFDEDEKLFLRRGYAGGRVEMFQYGYFPNVTVYDVNSLYPYAMKISEVPTSDRMLAVGSIDERDVGVYHIEFKQTRRDIPAVLTWGGKGIYEGEGVWFSPEVNLLREIDPTATIRLCQGYKFIDTGKIFAHYVDTLYAIRLEDKDGPLDLLAKFFLNSLYGKMGQKSERESIVVFNSIEEIEYAQKIGHDVTPIDEDSGVCSVVETRDCAFEHVGIAGIITSASRAILYRGLLEAGNGLIYCDTDSVHTSGTLPTSLVGSAIGLFKHEFSGEGVYCGKKLYGLRDSQGATPKGASKACNWPDKIRAKGVSVGGANGCRLGFSDLRRIAAGEVFEAKFKQPTTARQVFGGKDPCFFGDRKRRIKRT